MVNAALEMARSAYLGRMVDHCHVSKVTVRFDDDAGEQITDRDRVYCGRCEIAGRSAARRSEVGRGGADLAVQELRVPYGSKPLPEGARVVVTSRGREGETRIVRPFDYTTSACDRYEIEVIRWQ